MADERAMRNVEELFRLVRAQAAAVAELPVSDREGALTAIHAQHEGSGIKAGMSRKGALDMADRLDAWIRAALNLIALHGAPKTLH